MKRDPSNHLEYYGMTRRKFLRLASMSAAGFVIGCSENPVTGKKQLMLVSRDKEIQIDREQSPHQISSDYGRLRDKGLSSYITQIGRKLVPQTHRPKMPYSFPGVNATYVNAYAFPGGTIATTRGILLTLGSEAELAALLGHELGHVNARHSARQMSKRTLTSLGVGLLTAYVGRKYSGYEDLAEKLGTLGAGALLASYSRDNEREADALGNQYMVQAGYNTAGFTDLMEMLNSLSKGRSGITHILFSTHPMSDERYHTAIGNAQKKYESSKKLPLHRERYMDNISGLRAIKGAIEAMQKGDVSMMRQKYDTAETYFQSALKQAPEDYAGLLMMAKCQIAQGNHSLAQRCADKAVQIYPREAQAHHLSGFAKIKGKKFEAAYSEFRKYEQLLPGNPSTAFFKGFALEGMQKKRESAKEYNRYLQTVQQGTRAKHAYKRLVTWGYVKPRK
ncbi:M48 family metalloprotease [Desulfobacterales bacterium HSG2]|nr:M48 family metalloprotease [Desulfobacterales bacterium HSG2]